MTGLLVSVRNLEEAQVAFAGGADIIDIKEPSQGALGAVAGSEIRRIVAWRGGRQIPLSATIGDLPSDPEAVLPAIKTLHKTGVDFVKIGLEEPVKYQSLLRALPTGIQAGTKIILVIFADRTADVLPILSLAQQCGCTGVMLDTAEKQLGSLRAFWSDAKLATAIAVAQNLGLLFGLAGSLRIDDIPPLMTLGADYLGFRGAVCNQSVRTGQLDIERLATIRRLIPYPTQMGDLYRAVGGDYAHGG